MKNRLNAPHSVSPLLRASLAGCLAFSLVGILTGCGGPEKQQPVVAPATTPGGVSADDYAKHMQGASRTPGTATPATGAPATAPAHAPK